MKKYFLGTVELDRGGGYCVQTFLFTCYQERPGKRIWKIAQEWYPSVSGIDESRQLVYFNNWTIVVKSSVWLEITKEIYDSIKPIIQEVT